MVSWAESHNSRRMGYFTLTLDMHYWWQIRLREDTHPNHLVLGSHKLSDGLNKSISSLCLPITLRMKSRTHALLNLQEPKDLPKELRGEPNISF